MRTSGGSTWAKPERLRARRSRAVWHFACSAAEPDGVVSIRRVCPISDELMTSRRNDLMDGGPSFRRPNFESAGSDRR